MSAAAKHVRGRRRPAVGLLTFASGQWRVVHRLHVPRCPFAGYVWPLVWSLGKVELSAERAQ